jgi:hypothetical protein
MQPTIPQPSLAGHIRITRELTCRSINAALANRDRRRTEEEFVLCGWDGIYRKPSQIRAIIKK